MKTLIIEFSRSYLGFHRLTTGLFPGFTAGFIRVSYARGSLEAAIRWRVNTAQERGA